MNNQKLVTLTLTRGQVSDLLVFLSTMCADLDVSHIENLHGSIRAQLHLFDYNELCREIRLKSYMPYVRLIDEFCFRMSGACSLDSVNRLYTEALSYLSSWYLPEIIYLFLFRKLKCTSLSVSRRLWHCKFVH